MASYQTAVRDGAYTKIQAVQATLPITSFDLTKSYFPHYHLEDVQSQPVVAVTAIGMGAERLRQFRNAGVKKIDLAIMLSILKQNADKGDTSALDLLLELGEAILDHLEDDDIVSGVTWSNTEPLKDENGLIYDYESLAESGVFQSVSILHYNYKLQ